MIIRVADPTHVGEVRRQAAAYGEHANLTERERGSLSIVATEMTTNVLKHAGTGTLIVEPISDNGSKGVRILGLDRGPGIRDLNVALRDGYSTSGTSGNGLGAIKRLSSEFDIYTAPGLGTAVLAEFWPARKSEQRNSPVEAGVVSVPVRGEEANGDGWATKISVDMIRLMVVDGLGHGVSAAEAAREAERIFSSSKAESLGVILQDAHDALKKTRGAAMAVASLHFDRQLLTFGGVGNIAAVVITPTSSRGLASHNGTLGHQLQRIQEFTSPWESNSILVMHSDGLKSGWNLAQYPGIWSKHPGLIAGMLYRDFTRERDDVTVLVVKNREEAFRL
jgi:anti-sigma regulatory factor (Ser/Thr protein kinase)